jgi:hypothetical protein
MAAHFTASHDSYQCYPDIRGKSSPYRGCTRGAGKADHGAAPSALVQGVFLPCREVAKLLSAAGHM